VEVHADHSAGDGVGDELLLNLHRVLDNLVNSGLGEFGVKTAIHKHGELGVESLVARDEFVGEGQPGHCFS
jgi:hypothetical protein